MLTTALLALSLTLTGPASRHATLLAMGDVLLARGVGAAISKHGPDYPFEKVSPLLKRADLTVFNLECPLSTRGYPQHPLFLFRANPKLAVTLKKAGLQVAILANNHTLDYGRDSLLDTIAAVQRAGLVGVGAGRDRDEAIKPVIVIRNGLKIGILAYTDILNAGTVRRDDLPTVAVLHEDTLVDEIRDARSKCDSLLIYFHWGVEYVRLPTERQQHLARLCIDSGADLVLGCHPHVLQTVETYKGRPIVYSMGGFVFDSKKLGSDRSAIFQFTLSDHSAKLEKTIPITMKDGRTTIDRGSRAFGRGGLRRGLAGDAVTPYR